MRLRSILAGLLVGPSLLACSAIAADTGTSESNHTEGNPTFAQYAWQWSDETEDEFRKNAANTSSQWDGAPEFVAMVEAKLGRQLRPGRPGRKPGGRTMK